MELNERSFKLGMVTVLSSVKKTLAMYPDGMTHQEVHDMLDELDQQLGVKQIEMELLKRA